ncbi:MAG: septum formation family protein [Acidimicrobiia bacterium]
MRNMKALVLWVTLVVVGCGGGGSSSIFEVEVGHCFDDPADLAEVSEVEVVSCDEPHDKEVSDLPAYPAGPDDAYPGDAVIDAWASEACIGSFGAYVGISYEESVLVVGTLSPRAGTWEDGDREVICILYEPEQKLTGSMRNSGR